MDPPPVPVQPQPPREEISYPATRMMSIADLLEMNLEPIQTRLFKTPAERKEMPPLPVDYSFNSPDRARERAPAPARELAPAPVLPPQFNFANPNFPATNMHYHINNMAPPFYDMHYYAGSPLTAYGGLAPMNFNRPAHIPHHPPPYNPPAISPNAVIAKNPNVVTSETDTSIVKKEKKRRTTIKRISKFHPYEN